MGDICNMNDLDRFMRCREGKEYLEGVRQLLVGKRIQSVEFINEVHHIGLSLHLGNGNTIELMHPDLDVDALRESHADALNQEYYLDHSDQQPP